VETSGKIVETCAINVINLNVENRGCVQLAMKQR
jgi:hypothetical protein